MLELEHWAKCSHKTTIKHSPRIGSAGHVPTKSLNASKEGVFAGGDAVTGAATVILAMGAGKAGAKGIDEYLRSKGNE